MYIQELQDFREIISQMLADANDPHLFHSMLVHFPIVISLLGLVLVVVLLATRNPRVGLGALADRGALCAWNCRSSHGG